MKTVDRESNKTSSAFDSPAYSAKCMGQCVHPIFTQAGAAVVLGVTSNGVFLQHQSGQVCFVSGEVFHGPITINLERMINFKAGFAQRPAGLSGVSDFDRKWHADLGTSPDKI